MQTLPRLQEMCGKQAERLQHMFRSELITNVASPPTHPHLALRRLELAAFVIAKVWWVFCDHLTLVLHNTHLQAEASAERYVSVRHLSGRSVRQALSGV